MPIYVKSCIKIETLLTSLYILSMTYNYVKVLSGLLLHVFYTQTLHPYHIGLCLERVEVPLHEHGLSRGHFALGVNDLEDVMVKVLALEHLQGRQVQLVLDGHRTAVVQLVDLLGAVMEEC